MGKKLHNHYVSGFTSDSFSLGKHGLPGSGVLPYVIDITDPISAAQKYRPIGGMVFAA
jgi:hypothetical protein